MKNWLVIVIAIFANNVFTEISSAAGCSYQISKKIRYGKECEKTGDNEYKITSCDNGKPKCLYKGKIDAEPKPCNGDPGPGFAKTDIKKTKAMYGCEVAGKRFAADGKVKNLAIETRNTNEKKELKEFLTADCVRKNMKADNVREVSIYDNGDVITFDTINWAFKEETIEYCK